MNLISPLGRPSLPQSPTPSAVKPAKTPKSDFNQLSGAMNEDHFIKSINSKSQSTILRNVEGDLSGVEAASHVLALRRGQACGKTITHDDLFSFSEVTANNKVDLLIDREFARDGYFAAIRNAKVDGIGHGCGRIGQAVLVGLPNRAYFLPPVVRELPKL